MSNDREWIRSVVLGFDREDLETVPNRWLRDLLLNKHDELAKVDEIVCCRGDEIWDRSGRVGLLAHKEAFVFLTPQHPKKYSSSVRATIKLYPNGLVRRGTAGMVPISKSPRPNEKLKEIRWNASRRGNSFISLTDKQFINGLVFCGHCGKVSPSPFPMLDCLSELTACGDEMLLDDEEVESIEKSLNHFSCIEKSCEGSECVVETGTQQPRQSKRSEFTKPKLKDKKMLYVIASGSAVKIGVSNDPDRRVRNLQTGNHFPLKLAHAVEVENANLVECSVHNKLRSHQAEGEWFNVKVNDAIAAINSVLSGK